FGFDVGGNSGLIGDGGEAGVQQVQEKGIESESRLALMGAEAVSGISDGTKELGFPMLKEAKRGGGHHDRNRKMQVVKRRPNNSMAEVTEVNKPKQQESVSQRQIDDLISKWANRGKELTGKQETQPVVESTNTMEVDGSEKTIKRSALTYGKKMAEGSSSMSGVDSQLQLTDHVKRTEPVAENSLSRLVMSRDTDRPLPVSATVPDSAIKLSNFGGESTNQPTFEVNTTSETDVSTTTTNVANEDIRITISLPATETDDERNHDITVSPSDTVQRLVYRLELRMGLTEDDHFLFLSDGTPMKSSKYLWEYSVRNGDTLNMLRSVDAVGFL
ncbi:hypothetical protein HDU76_010350, partial [Blyttiomyces sp. JEL0837]